MIRSILSSFSHALHLRIALGVFACASPLLAQHATPTAAPPTLTYAQLHEGFAHPPQAAKLRCYWWWLNGNTDEATITNDLQEMAKMGFGGALLVDADGSGQNGNKEVPAGPLFGSPAWIRLYQHALKEAARLHLEITLNITSGWNLGGPQVTPEQASKILTWSRTQAAGGKHLSLTLADPPSKNDFYRQIAVLAYPLHHGTALQPQPDDRQGDQKTDGQGVPRNTLSFRSAAAETGFSMPDSSAMLNPGPPTPPDAALSEVQDLTSTTHGGKLEWDAPAGEWELLRIGYTDSGARVSTASGTWQGLAIDYLDHTAFDSYWTSTVAPLLAASKPWNGVSLKYLATDSWELKGTNWTPAFREHFHRLRGYDPLPYLPIAAGRILQDRDTSTRFLTDLRRTVADLVVSEHYDVFAAHARRYGLGIHPESGGPHGAPIDALETFRSTAFAQTEYWAPNPHRARPADRFFTKQGASAKNIYGLPFNAQEGMTSIGPQWSESLANDLKPSFDRAITEGMTRLIWHEFTSSPAASGLPGQEYFAGTHLNPKVTWWPVAADFFAYLNRAQFLAQQGTPVNDVLYYYGDNVPNFVRLKADDPAHVLPGYDYDVTNQDALLRTIHTTGGRLTGPQNIQWRVFTMPATRRLSLSVLQKLADFVQQGGAVAGLPPTSTSGNIPAEAQATFDRLVHTVWQDCAENEVRTYGKGKLFCYADTRRALAELHIAPDFSAAPELDYIHRRIGSTDLYFVRNTTDKPIDTPATVRIGHKAPELWDPLTGTTAPAPSYALNPDGTITLPIRLAANGSVAIAFHAPIAKSSPKVAPREPQFVPINTPWNLRFAPNRGAPTEPITLTKLDSWITFTAPGVRFYSGPATYTTTFEFPRQTTGPVLLHLSHLREVARVRVNGHSAGTIWANPLELRIDRWLKPGQNTLEIEVTNLWPNRIIGDLQPQSTTHYTSTNITAYRADSQLLDSGLIGTVFILLP